MRLGRPIRVLDLGCAQGWFSFKLAESGAHVFGVDYLGSNINVCNMLVLENRHLQARFKIMEIEHIPALLETNSFDMVLGLSVFHHLCLHNGKEVARDILDRIAQKIPICLFEFALADEPTTWAKAQPEQPDYLVRHIPFFYTLDYYTVHLSSVARPLYFCSYHFWYLNGELDQFMSWREGNHRRRYFFNDTKIAYLFPIVGESADLNRYAVNRTTEFLKSPP